MAVIFVDINPFSAQEVAGQVLNAEVPIRRPYWGLYMKENQVGNLQILAPGAGGVVDWVNVINSSSPSMVANGTSNFTIARISRPRQEKVQIVQSFGRDFMYVFGEEPRFLQISGVLLNTPNYPWRNEWLRNYEDTLRASRTVEKLARVYLSMDGIVSEGHLVSSTTEDVASNPNATVLSFVMYVVNEFSTAIPLGDESQSENLKLGEYDVLPDEFRDLYSATPSKGELANEKAGFYVDPYGNIAMNAVGGRYARYQTQYEAAAAIDIEAAISSLVKFGVAEAEGINLESLREARRIIQDANSGYGPGDGSSFAGAANRYSEFLTSGVGGYAANLGRVGDDIRAIALGA